MKHHPSAALSRPDEGWSTDEQSPLPQDPSRDSPVQASEDLRIALSALRVVFSEDYLPSRGRHRVRVRLGGAQRGGGEAGRRPELQRRQPYQGLQYRRRHHHQGLLTLRPLLHLRPCEDCQAGQKVNIKVRKAASSSPPPSVPPTVHPSPPASGSPAGQHAGWPSALAAVVCATVFFLVG
ncbi:hypothetical protein OPV22_018239 [Ensete ventricosum]|uniref:Uncharacterized protein n=1 Tax=Ensete ventricosum TaxID=4639 RepID=A0AAV8QQ49_ENSVE|nr:hypothetical protein OPV22_018239 [Ensete ventricosum]